MHTSQIGGVNRSALLLGSVAIAFSLGPCPSPREKHEEQKHLSLESRIDEDPPFSDEQFVKRVFTPSTIEAIEYVGQLAGNALLDVRDKKRLGEYFMLLSDSCDIYFWYAPNVSLAQEYSMITQPRKATDIGHTYMRPDVLLKVLAWKSKLGYSIDKTRQIIYVTQKDRPPY